MAKKRASEATVQAFIKAVYPEMTELCVASNSEEEILTEATRLILDHRAPDALVEAISWGLSAFRSCVGLVPMIDGEGIIAVRAGRAALRRVDAALAALKGEVK